MLSLFNMCTAYLATSSTSGSCLFAFYLPSKGQRALQYDLCCLDAVKLAARLQNCSNSISIAPIQYETRFPSKHHWPHLIQVLADKLRSVTKARTQYEIIPLIEIRILRLIDSKISKLRFFFINHQNY